MNNSLRIGGCLCREVPEETKHWFCPTHGNCTRGISPQMGLTKEMLEQIKATQELKGRIDESRSKTCSRNA